MVVPPLTSARWLADCDLSMIVMERGKGTLVDSRTGTAVTAPSSVVETLLGQEGAAVSFLFDFDCRAPRVQTLAR